MQARYCENSLGGVESFCMAGVALERAPMRQVQPLGERVNSILYRVPGPEGRAHLSSDLLNTAGHEFQHAWVAYRLGAAVVDLTVKPSGKTLGKTTFAGHIEPDTFKIIAAAGSVATFDGQAHGFSHDLYQAHRTQYWYGGMSVEDARTVAADIVSEITPEVRRKAAEIIAFLGDVPGSWIPQIIKRAEMEVQGEADGDFVLVKPASTFDKTRGEYTEIENLGDSYRIIHIVDGKLIKEKYMCSFCNGINGQHSYHCPLSKSRLVNKQEAGQELGQFDSEQGYPREIVITSQNSTGDIFLETPQRLLG